MGSSFSMSFDGKRTTWEMRVGPRPMEKKPKFDLRPSLKNFKLTDDIPIQKEQADPNG